MSSPTVTPPLEGPVLGPAVPGASAPPPAGAAEPGPGPGRRRWWRREPTPDPWRPWVLAGLRGAGCLLCREEEEHLRRYYFWFLEEQYATRVTAERLQRARGFCLRHTRHLLEHGKPYRLSVVAGYVLGGCADWLGAAAEEPAPRSARPASRGPAQRGPLAAAEECPACADARDSRERHVHAVTGCLEGDGEVWTALRESWGLCLPHLLGLMPHLGWRALQRLAEEGVRPLEQACARMEGSGGAHPAGDGAEPLRSALLRLFGADHDAGLRALLRDGRRAIASGGKESGSPARSEAEPSGTWSPAFREACELLRRPGCSVCRVAARAREEYLAWLETEIRDFAGIGYRWDRAQDLCPEHAWLFADRCRPEVLALACARWLGGALHGLRSLRGAIGDPIPPTLLGRVRALPSRWRESSRPEHLARGRAVLSARLRKALGTLWLTPRQLLDQALARSFHARRCPLCSHLETVECRAADRLAAVLEDPEGRRAFERSYGTCVRHGALLLERASGPALRRYLAAVLLARVEVDRWEVEEYLRKQAWDRRHEPKGAEETAWVRAWDRLAGAAAERRYGF